MRDEGRRAELITRLKNIRTLNDLKAHHRPKVNDLYRNHPHNADGDSQLQAAFSEMNRGNLKISVRRRRYHDRRIGMFFSLVAAIIIVSAIVIAIFLGFIE